MPLPSRNRLNLRLIGDDFYDRSHRIHSSFLTAFILPNTLGLPRFAIVVSKKTNSLSVGRNQLRRQIAAIIQENLATTSTSLDIVISLKPSAKTLSFEELNKAILSLFTNISNKNQ